VSELPEIVQQVMETLDPHRCLGLSRSLITLAANTAEGLSDGQREHVWRVALARYQRHAPPDVRDPFKYFAACLRQAVKDLHQEQAELRGLAQQRATDESPYLRGPMGRILAQRMQQRWQS